MIFISMVFKVDQSSHFPVKASLYNHNSLVQSFDNVHTFFVVPRSVVLEIAAVKISGVPG
jgi:hypothetical protein